MAQNIVPAGYHTITPYLTVADAALQMEFLKEAFGAQATETLSKDDTGTIFHAEMKIGDSMLMIGQAGEKWTPRPGTFYLYVADCDVVYQQALQAGAKSVMEPADQFYGDRNAGVEDPNGNYWWLATRVEDVAPDELEKRAKAAYAARK